MNIYVDANWDGASAAPEGYDAIFANLTDAVNAASTTEATTITVAAGTYGDNITLDARTMEQKGDIAFKAVEGAEVKFTGLCTIGYYEKRVGNKLWNAAVSFENIIFDQEAAATNSLDIQDIKSFSMTNCTIIGDGSDYGLIATNDAGSANITACVFENAILQSIGNFGTGLSITGCTFDDSRVNIQSGDSVTISGCNFTGTITDASVGGSFYCVRSNSCAITIENSTFDIDAELTGAVSEQADWAIFWARNKTDIPWNVNDVEVNLSEAAVATDLSLTKNGKTPDQSTPDRITIDGLTSSSNDVAELLSKTQGDLTVKQGDAEITYKDGVMSMPAFDGVDNLVICNLDDLKEFRDMVNAGENFKGKTITLAADIDLNNEEWTPIGTQSNKFLGNFDGAGHTIKNLVVDGDIYWGSGFFGNVTNGNPEIAHNVIKNLTIENASISGTHSVGAVAGSAFCTDVSNVAVIGNVNINGSWYVGAAFGRFEYGNLDGCVIDVTSGKVYSKDSNYIGGAIGFTAEGALKYSNISSNINVETEGDCDFVGGVFGLLHYNNSVDGVECNADSIVCENATTGAIAGAWGNEKGTTVVVKNATVGENTKVTVDGQEVETAIMGSPRFEETTESGSLAVVETNDKGEVTKVIEVSGPKGMETALNSGTTTMYVSMEDKDGNIDVFSSINEAMLAAQENGGGTIVMYGTNDAASVVDDTAIWRTNGTYTFTGGDYFNFNSWVQTPKSSEGIENVDVNIVFDDAKVVVGKFRLDTGSTLTITDTHMDGVSYINDGRTWLTFYGDSVINISNSVVGYKVQYNGDNSDAIKAGDKETDYSNVKGAMTFYGSGVLNVTDSTLFGYSTPSNGAVFAVTDKGLFTFTDSAIYGGSIAIGINDNVTVGRDGEVATMIFDNSEFNYINGDYQDPYACKITVGGDKDGKLIVRNNSEINFTNDETKGVVVNSNGEVEISNSKFNANAVTNNGAINVKGESTLKIDSLTGEEVNLLDGAIVKDSTVGGAAFVAGNVTFRGDNTFAMLYDYGVLTDYYGTTAPMKWTVEEGASLVLTDKARYGLGYGDVVTINGNIAKNGAAAARETLTDDNAENDVKTSLFMHGLVAQESKGWDCNSSLTVNNAYVQIGSNNSFGNKPGNYGGVYTIKFNNAVLDSSRITFYEALSQTTFTFTNSNAKVGTFMTNDADSVFTLDNTVLLSTTTTNGTDEGNYNAGELNVVNNSSLTYSADVTNKKGASINVEDSEFIAPALTNDGTFKVTGTKGSTLDIATVTGNAVQLAGALVNSNVGGNIEVNGNSAIKADANETTEDVTAVTGIVKVVNGSTLTVEDGATFETKHIALGNDNYGTLNIGEVTGAEKGGKLVVEGTIKTDKLNVNSNAAMTIEKDAVVTTGTIAIEDGGIAVDENNKAGYLKIEDGGTLNTKYLNAFNGGKVDVEGTVNIGNDKRANYSTVVKGGGEVNVAATGLISGDGYNGKVEANGVLNINGGKVEFKDLAGQVTAEQGNFQNAGTINMNGGTLDVDTLTGSGTVEVTGNATLNIGELAQQVNVNKDSSTASVLTGDIGKLTSNLVVYDSTTVSGLKVNSAHEEDTIKAPGKFVAKGDILITDNSEIVAGSVQIQNSGVLEAGSVLKANDFNVWDYTASNGDAIFIVKGRIEAVTFVILNDYYYPGNDNFIIDAGGVLRGENQVWGNANPGIFNIQGGNMTVYGYVDSDWNDEGGDAKIGGNALGAVLTVDGTYAAEDNNNGKFINVGDQKLIIGADANLNVINGALFSWANKVNNAGTITVDAQSLVVIGDTFTNTGALNINVDALTGGVATVIDAVAGTKDFGTVNLVDKNGNAVTGYNVRVDETNGDLILYKEAGATVYVNAEWAGKSFGDAITYGDKTLSYGIDAFDSLSNVTASDETKNLVIVGGSYNPANEEWVSMLKDGINNVTTVGEVVVEKGNLFFNATAAGEYNISGDYVANGVEGYNPWPTWGTNGIVRFQGADGVVFNLVDADITAGATMQFIGGKTVISVDSTLTGNAATESKMAVYADVVNYGKIELVTSANSGTGLLIGHASYANNANKLTVSGKDASVNVAVNGSAEANKDVDIHSSGKLVVENGASFTAANDVNNAGSVVVDDATFKAGNLINNSDITLKGTATFDVEDFDNNATLTLDGFTGDLADSLEGDKQGIVEAFGTNVITDNINTMEMYFGQKWVGDEDDDFEKGRETKVTIGNEENKVTVNVETFYNKGTAATTVANGSTLNVGYIKNYGKLDVDGVVNLTTDASKGTSGIGRAEAAVGYDNTKSVINVTGEFSVNTNEGATENNFVIYDNTSLNVAGGKFNADENTSIINDGNFNLVGNVTVNITNYEGNAVNVAKGVVLNNSSLKADLNIAGNITVTDSTLSGKFTGKKVTVTLDGTNNIVLADDSNVALFFDGKNADVITEGSYFGKSDISGKNNAVLTVDNDAFNGNKISGVKLNLTGFNFDEDSENYDVVSNVNVALDSILSINGVEVVKVVDSRIVEIDGVKYELLNTDKKITLNKISDDASSSVINVKTFSLGKGQDVDYSDYTFNMLSGNRKLDVKNDAVLKLAAITKEGKGVTNIVLGKNAELYVGDVEAIGKLSTGAGAAVEMGNVTATDANASIALGADNKASMADVDLKGGKNSVTIGARSTVDMASLAGAASINLASGTAAKYKKGVLVVDEVRTELNIAGDLNADAKGTAIKAGNYADLNVGGNMNDIASINIGTSAALKTTDINGTAKNNTLTFGKNASVDVQNIDLKDGKNAIVLNANVDFDADSISNVYKISTGKGSKFTVNNIVSENIANNYNFGANNEVDIKAIVMSATTKNSVKVGANSVFNVEENIAGAYRITTEKAALFNVNKISATELADVISFGANTVNNISAIDMAKGNDKLSLAANSRTFINTIAFGEGKDTLSFAKGAELSVDGGIISGLDVVSGNSSNVIYLYNDARLVDAVEVKNLNKINVVSAEYIDGVIGINQIGSLTYNGGNTEFDLLDNNGRDTFKLDGNSIFKIQSLDDVKVSYLKNGVWYDLVDPMIAIENAEMVSVSLKEFDKKPKGEIEYTYSITSL